MSSFGKFLLGRILAIPVTLFIITFGIFAIITTAPPEELATLYFPPNIRSSMPPEMIQAKIDQIIEEHGLDDPLPVQYVHWIGNLIKGDWGWSPTFNGDVLPLLKQRTPVSAELTFYSLIFLFPVALVIGLIAGWLQGGRFDSTYRFTAFLGLSIPPFILGLFLISVFYVGLHWFPLGRTGIHGLLYSPTSDFVSYTGFLTIDGLLNGRLDVTVDAARRLVLPVLTLSFLYWATISRVTRVAVIEEKNKDYIVFAKARGLKQRTIVGRHAFRNAMLPSLTIGILSAASIITGVFVVERVFDLKGLSGLLVGSFVGVPDTPMTLGFAVYSTLLVIPIMFILDLLRGVIDPRLREGD
ncbi:MAG: ABC transporter permease [Candidatus Promineifilaceae bacterium]|jgi:ABC-type dipeptide/oligopeptide/nickel transport system permease component